MVYLPAGADCRHSVSLYHCIFTSTNRLLAPYLYDERVALLRGQMQGAMAVGTPCANIGLVFEQQRSGLFVPTRTRDVQRPSKPIRQGGFEVTPEHVRARSR